jgi:trehalose 6-phosphate synthase
VVEQVRATIHDLIGGRQLVVLSNREPYTHRHGKRGVVVERPEGGLVAALDPVLQTVGGSWVAWGSGDADFDFVDARDSVQVPVEAPQYVLRRIRLNRQEVERFYHGFSNQSLWHLFHLAVDKARFVASLLDSFVKWVTPTPSPARVTPALTAALSG